MNENDTMVVRMLSASYRLQAGYYARMSDMVQGLLSRLILGRGDSTSVKTAFVEKQKLLQCIEAERNKIAGHISVWRERKAFCAGDPAAREFDRILQETEKAIHVFLEAEEQLKKYIVRMIQKGT